MTRTGLAVFVMLLAGTPARAGGNPGSGGLPLAKPMVTPQSLMLPAAPQPSRYAMTYSESIARSLGVEQGQVNLVPNPRSPYVPSVSLNGNMLRLQWRP